MTKENLIKTIDYVLLSILGVFCFRYISFYGRYFSETHVQFDFLNFPVFIGEFLLLGCLILFSVKLWLAKIKLNVWHYLVMFYFSFVVVKALWGYVHWGPLAFRDAALFYYFAFAVIAYFSYRSDYFNRFVILICYALLMSFYFMPKFNDFWLVGRLLLGLILAYRYPDRRIGALMAMGILICTPYKYFTETARTFILGNFIAAIYLIATLTSCFNRKIRKWIMVGGALLIVALGFYIFKFSGNCTALTIFQWDKIAAIYQDLEKDINAGAADYQPEVITQVRIFNPDPPPNLNTSVSAESTADHSGNSAHSDHSENREYSEGFENPVADEESADVKADIHAPLTESEKKTVQSNKMGNAIFRLFMWRDVITALAEKRPLLGFDFGKPFRSRSLEIIRSAIGEWSRDGWISMHNSYLNILYRSGVFGVAFLAIWIWVFISLTRLFIRLRSFVGLALCALLLNWFMGANFAVVFELPYMAIPLWTLFGLTLAFAHTQTKAAGSRLK